MKVCYVYLIVSETGTLYTGVTSNLVYRIGQHKNHVYVGFSCRHSVYKLLYYETFGTPIEAIRREKQIKSWRREKKIQLIALKNPGWQDLSADWF
jgi:putative endonuclease